MLESNQYFVKSLWTVFLPQFKITDKNRKLVMLAKQKFTFSKFEYEFFSLTGQKIFIIKQTAGFGRLGCMTIVISDLSDTVIGKLRRIQTSPHLVWEFLDSQDRVIGRAEEDIAAQVFDRAMQSLTYLSKNPGMMRTGGMCSYNLLKEKKCIGSFSRASSLRDGFLLDLTRDAEPLLNHNIVVPLTIALLRAN